MKITPKETNAYTRELFVSVPWTELEEHFDGVVSHFKKNVKLPGFRKGKVPRNKVLQQFGAEIEADFAQQSVERYYAQALDEQALHPVNRAEVKDLDFTRGNELSFTVIFEVEPKVNLPKYSKKIKVTRKLYISDDEDVDRYLFDLRQHQAELKTVESGSEENHLLLVDMQELDETGYPIIGRKVEDRYIKIGDGVFGGDNLNLLTGLSADDTVRISIPTESGSTAYELTVKNVQQEILPEVDEEFIKKMDPEAETEEDLRNNIAKGISKRLENDSETQLRKNIISWFVEQTSLEVPPSMIDNYLDNLVEDIRSRNGETLDEDKYRSEMRSSTERSVKWYLIRKALIVTEAIEVSDEELKDEVSSIVESVSGSGQSKEIERFYKKPSNRDGLLSELIEKKLFALLKSYAKIDEVEIQTSELRKQG